MQFVDYCKYNNWKSVDKQLIINKIPSYWVFEGFEVACKLDNILTIDVFIKHYGLSKLLKYQILRIILNSTNNKTLNHFIKNHNLKFTYDNIYPIESTFVMGNVDIINYLLDNTNLYDLVNVETNYINIDFKNYCNIHMRHKKLKKLLNG